MNNNEFVDKHIALLHNSDCSVFAEAKAEMLADLEAMQIAAKNEWIVSEYDELVNFNTNFHVLVKLEEHAFQHWANYYNEHYARPDYPHLKPANVEELKSRIRPDGYHEFQMHEMMEIFGRVESKEFMNTNVKLYRRELNRES